MFTQSRTVRLRENLPVARVMVSHGFLGFFYWGHLSHLDDQLYLGSACHFARFINILLTETSSMKLNHFWFVTCIEEVELKLSYSSARDLYFWHKLKNLYYMYLWYIILY